MKKRGRGGTDEPAADSREPGSIPGGYMGDQMMITDEDVTEALKWLQSLENAARLKKQREHESKSKLAQKVIKALAGR